MKIKIFSCVTAVLGLFLGWSAFAQNTTVTGRVVDGATNEPIVGAAVMVKGTNTGDVTQNDGTYSIKAPASAVLICQFFGYKTIEEPLNGRSKVDFVLFEDTETLEATVVVAASSET